MTCMDSLVAVLRNALELTSGCTEPAAIAYCASYAGRYLDERPPISFQLTIDQRTYKNAFAAGIPHAGMRKGTEWALLLGFVTAAPEKRLALFGLLNEDFLKQADKLHVLDIIDVELIDTEGLLIELTVKGATGSVRAKLEGGHTRLTCLSVNGEDRTRDLVPPDSAGEAVREFPEDLFKSEHWPEIIEALYDDHDLQQTVRQGIAYNMAAALHGRRYVKSPDDDTANLVMGAIYSRMNGDPIPVMSCAGSGNKGLTSFIPVVDAARKNMLGEEAEIKAVMVAVLLTTLITSRFGEVSSVCGAQYAAGAGIIGGILYLRNELHLFDGAYNNFVSAISGGFCDGAKGSCSMRGSIAVSAAMTAIKHAEAGFIVSARDGFLGESFQNTLDNLVKYNPLIARFELETIKILKEK